MKFQIKTHGMLIGPRQGQQGLAVAALLARAARPWQMPDLRLEMSLGYDLHNCQALQSEI